jgi:chaperonin GroES
MALSQLTPLHDRIIVERLAGETQTKSGLILSSGAVEKPDQGTVVAVGSGRLLKDGTQVPLEVRVGDLVLFGSTAGQNIKVDDKPFLVLKEEEIYAILDN